MTTTVGILSKVTEIGKLRDKGKDKDWFTMWCPFINFWKLKYNNDINTLTPFQSFNTNSSLS